MDHLKNHQDSLCQNRQSAIEVQLKKHPVVLTGYFPPFKHESLCFYAIQLGFETKLVSI